MLTISVDTGGTFTDVAVADESGQLQIAKALTSRDRAYDAIAEALDAIARRMSTSRGALLEQAARFNYGTTRSTNAVVEGKASRTAFFTTKGFPDVLLLREGGKPDPFRQIPYGQPYVPRHLTFEIDERMDAEGTVFRPLDEASVITAIRSAQEQEVEAVGVCLLWSIANSAHELRVGQLMEEHAPDLAFTLSHQLNPVVREYRRASATVIDASLKPLMQQFIRGLEQDLRGEGFMGNLFISTSYGGSWSPQDVAERPVYSIGSGPSMAPVSAVHEANRDLEGGAAEFDLLVADTGGTTFDIGIVRSGQIEFTNETWLGGRWIGNITGTRAVDVKSIGAGGGSIAWIDSGGLLKVGPQSAGSSPGPACYGRGGSLPTVTDAALLLGYLDSSNFMEGSLHLDRDAAERAFAPLSEALGMTLLQMAHATLTIACDNIAASSREATVARGIDPREVVIVAGGGGSGMSIGRIAEELGTRGVLIPQTAGAMSACGALFADVIHEFTCVAYVETAAFDSRAANAALAQVSESADRFLSGLSPGLAIETEVQFAAEARYRQQAWELTVPLPDAALSDGDVALIEETFHDTHERMFGVREPNQTLEILSWTARATARLRHPSRSVPDAERQPVLEPLRVQDSSFDGVHLVPVPVYWGPSMPVGHSLLGPAIVHEPTTTIVLYPGHTITVMPSGNYYMETPHEHA
ncbi:MAG TPA: 5-oxoprolinase [Actinobacteria bacterium]|nr:5-oxoprolinase [Actinomycetota bacterium]